MTCGGYLVRAGVVICVFVGSGMLIWWYQLSSFVGKEDAWVHAIDWRQTQCQVLAAGVTCTNKETQSSCAGYVSGGMPEHGYVVGALGANKSKVPLFFNDQVSVCPGTYWCAKEQEICSCEGEITYSSELFDGFVYTISSANAEYKVQSHGQWKCGTDQNGQPFPDPKPFVPKYCWCTPNVINKVLEPFALHKKTCSEASNRDFEDGRRLSKDSKVFLHRELVDMDSHADWKAEYTYMPWALIKVQDEYDDFSSDQPDAACAYEYGVPQASEQFYVGDFYADEKDLEKAENVARKWYQDPLRPCWVRTPGPGGELCSFALERPSVLDDQSRELFAECIRLLFVSVAFGSVCVLLGVCLMSSGHDCFCCDANCHEECQDGICVLRPDQVQEQSLLLSSQRRQQGN